MLHLLCVKINTEFKFEKYLYLFNENTQLKIKSFRFRKDQVTAFTSELLKYYYLAKRLNLTPDDIHIKYTIHNRPYIEHSNIDFNISHCNEYVIFALSIKSKIGIDIEYNDPRINAIELGSIVFSDYEQNLIQNNTSSFFKIWTKKEALIKAYGTGFGTDDYKLTKLNLEATQELKNATIYNQAIFDNYYIGLCILNA